MADRAAPLKDFLEALDDLAPTIPDELVQFYLQQVGFSTADPRVLRMVSLAAHQFLLEVSQDALQFHRIRAQAAVPSEPASKVVLTMEDLSASLKEYGVNLCKPEYYSDVSHET